MDWKQIYLLPRLVTLDNYSRSFQYKILNNVLYLNKKLFTFRKSTSPLCPFCKFSDETVLHLFYECDVVQSLWNELDLFFENDFTLFDLKPKAVFLGFLNIDSKLFLDLIKFLIRKIMKFKNIEEKTSINNEKKHTMYKKKWHQVENVLKSKTF